MMNFIFLDVEWNLKNNDILSIGALGVNRKFKPQKEFFSLVKPVHMDELEDNLISFIHTSREDLANARDVATVFDAFKANFDDIYLTEAPTFVVWGRETYTLFKEAASKNGFKLPATHKVVVLQEILRFVNYKIPKHDGMSFFMHLLGVEFDKARLHDSLYDVDMLSDMYMCLKRRFFKAFAIHPVYLYKSQESNILHKPACRYREQILPENMLKVNITNLLFGDSMCSSCYRDIEWRKEIFTDAEIFQSKSQAEPKPEIKVVNEFSDENISRLCSKYGFEYSIACGLIYVKTTKGSWMIAHDASYVNTLFHKNYDFRVEKNNKHNGKKKDVFRNGYHDQRLGKSSLEAALKYIYNHDNNPYAYTHKKSRLEELFDQIRKAS